MVYFILSIVTILLLIIGVCSIFIYRKYSKQLKFCKFHNRIFSAIPISMFLLDKNKCIVNVYNITPATMAGYSINDILGKNISFFANNKQSPLYQAYTMLDRSFDRVVKTKNIDCFQYMIGDGYFESTVQLLKDDYVLNLVQDISQSTRAANKQMHKKQNEIAVALCAGGLTSWTYDVKTKVIDSSIENNIIDGSITYDNLLAKIHVEDRHLVENAFKQLLNKESTHSQFATRVTTKDGVMLWTKVHAVPDEYDSNGNVKTIIGSQKDISKQIETMNELIQLREKAEESNRLKSAFLANMSHEIRTPLNAIVGFSNLISTIDDKALAAEYAQIIEQNNTILLDIINDVLDLSGIESDKMKFTFTTINVNSMLQHLTQMTRLKMKDNMEVDVILDPVSKELEIYSDQIRLSQVITNFLNNASKFTIRGSIHIGCEPIGDRIYFYVQDTGTGIAQENIETIFDRFVKLDTFTQGTGLGLSICQTIINMLNGEIGVESELGVGSKFWFNIPSNCNDTVNRVV